MGILGADRIFPKVVAMVTALAIFSFLLFMLSTEAIGVPV
jgi:hypothetical protein